MEACFWHLKQLSDQQLLARLQGVLQTKRRTLAELIAQLGEVEERRLHLQAACGSLFSYCVQRGSAKPDNLRMLCRSHNRLAAERAYGRAHIEQAIRARQRSSLGQRPC